MRALGGVRTGLKNTIGGLLAGIALLLVTMSTLFWNEGRAVKRAVLLEDGREQVRVVEASPLDRNNDGRLILVSGELRGETLRDPDFGMGADALGLRRHVEMLQWQEKSTRRKTDNGDNQTEYQYEQVWSDRLIDHRQFNRPEQHQNPDKLPFSDQLWRASRPTLGAFTLDGDVVDALSSWQSLTPDIDALPPNLAASLRVEAGALTSASSLDTATVGDVRIRFEYIPLGRASVIAQQSGNLLTTYAHKRGPLLLAERGTVSANALFDAAEKRNTTLGWSLRVAGFFAFWAAFGLMLSPIRNLLASIPLLGSIGRFATSLLSGLLAFALSLMTVVSGWLFHRPWLMGLMLITLIALVVWMIRRSPSRTSAPLPTPAQMPPPPPTH